MLKDSSPVRPISARGGCLWYIHLYVCVATVQRFSSQDKQEGMRSSWCWACCLWCCFEFGSALQTNRLEFRWSRSICHEDHSVRADWLLLIGFGLCLPIFVCTEHCGRLVSTLASYFGDFGFKRRNGPAPHVLTEVFRTSAQSPHANWETHLQLRPTLPSLSAHLSQFFCPLSTIPFDLSHLHLVPMFKMSRAIYTSLYACMAWTKIFLFYFTKW